MFALLASSMFETILGGGIGASIRHSTFIRREHLIQTYLEESAYQTLGVYLRVGIY